LLAQTNDNTGGWKLLMETAIGGRYDVFFTGKALRIDSQSFKYSLLATAPQWNLTIWRDDSKEICHCTLAQYLYQRRSAVNTTSSCNLDKPISKHAIAIPRFGLSGVQYVYAGEKRGHDLFISDKATTDVKNYFIDCANIDLPRPACADYQAVPVLYRICQGLPYQMFEVLESGPKQWQVLTRSMVRQKCRLQQRFFKCRVATKIIGTFKHNFLFKSVSSMMDDTVDSIGIGEIRPSRSPERSTRAASHLFNSVLNRLARANCAALLLGCACILNL
jgi:hypothetical protein